MVLINGVKYACERCIRGHRVTTCIHTDQPLTMIKPKGRPATQCQHCRDSRKLKNLHTSCTCGKKGKGGTHSAGCACHKTSHCTCTASTKTTPSNIHHLTASEKAKKQSLITAANAEVKRKSETSLYANSDKSEGSKLDLHQYIVDDMSTFNANSAFYGLMQTPENFPNGPNRSNISEVFNPSSSPSPTATAAPTAAPTGRPGNPSYLDNDLHEFDGFDIRSGPEKKSSPSPVKNNPNVFDLNDYSALDAPQLSPNEMDLVDNRFPLFPLVGQFSFDENDGTQPLSALPEPKNQNQNQNQNTQKHQYQHQNLESHLQNHQVHQIPQSHQLYQQASQAPNVSQASLPQRADLARSQSQSSQYSGRVRASSASSKLSRASSMTSTGMSQMNGYAKTHQPKPFRPAAIANTSSSASSVNGSAHHQPMRPKRPESVLSVTSNSSKCSFDTTHNTHNSFINGNLPSSSNSAAFPPSVPFPASETNSSAIFGENDLGNTLSDELNYDHFGRSGLGSVYSSTNGVPKENEESADFLFYDNIVGNNDTLSTSSSFVNFNPGNKPAKFHPMPSTEKSLNGDVAFDKPISNSSSSSSSLLDLLGGSKASKSGKSTIKEDEIYGSTDVIPPSQLPFDYDLSVPMMLDFMPMDNQTNQKK